MKKSDKFLIALQVWEGDRAQGEALARYLADLEPGHCELADFLIVHRNDCKLTPSVQAYVSRKFNTFVYRAPRGNTGWPAGCNSLWTNTVIWIKTMMDAGKIPAYKAAFTCESDGGPVFPDWVSRMSKAWDLANSTGPVCVAGPVVTIPAEHMNGNLIVSCEPETLQWLTRLALHVPATGGWDYLLSPQFKKRGWANVPGMVSYYNSKTFSAEQFRKMQNDELIWVHGIKDHSLIELGRAFSLTENRLPRL